MRVGKEVLIVLLLTMAGLAIRTIALATIPPGLFSDEASTGYDAFSLLLTARDQHGNFLPLFAESFGDYNEALYRYLVVPSVAVFGLHEFAVRLPAAIIGTLTIPVIYLLARLLFDGRTAGFSALLLTFSPWHVQFSRVAFRGITFPFVFMLALVCLLLSQRKSAAYLFLSFGFFALSLWTYAAARVFVPLVVVGVCVYLWRSGYFRRHPRYTVLSALLFACTFSAFLAFWLSPAGMARARHEVSLDFTTVVGNYLSYFNPVYLFRDGDSNLRHSPAGMGQLHLFEAGTVLVGMVDCLRIRRRRLLLLLIWLALYPIPAALTAPANALRSIVGAPAFAILSGAGLSAISGRITERLRVAGFGVMALVLSLSIGLYLKCYFFDYPTQSCSAWQYGMREMIDCAKERPETPVFIADNIPLAYPFVLFYEQYPPPLYQRDPIAVEQGRWYYTDRNVGRYRFDSINDLPAFLTDNESCLIICPPSLVPTVAALPRVAQIRTILDPNGGQLLFTVFEYNRNADKIHEMEQIR